MKILFRDNDIIVCIKPSGAVSTDEAGGMPELIRKEIGEDKTVRCVHRLDSVVAGIMVYALSQEAASQLSRQITEGIFVKEYMAVLEGHPEANQGKLRDYLRRNAKERKTYAFDKPGKGAQEAELLYQECAKTEKNSLVRIKLITGRTHQIRAQFSSRQLPLYGDRKYGAANTDVKIALWSCHLCFQHPITRDTMDFSAMPPARIPWTFFDGYYTTYDEQDVEVEFKRSVSFSDCRYAEICGGCAYQGIDYQKQLEKKQKVSGKFLKNYCEASPIIGMEKTQHYKNTTVISFGTNKNGSLISGIYAKASRRVIRMEQCPLAHEKTGEIASTIRSLMEKYEIPPFDEKKKTGWLKHALIRVSQETGEILLAIVAVSDDFKSRKAFVKELCQAYPEITSITLSIQPGNSPAILGKETRILYGSGCITDRLCGNRYQITAKSLFPVNPVQAEKLYQTAIELAALTGSERVLDIGCGIGILGITVAPRVKKVLGVEAFRDTADEAENNLKQNHVTNMRIICSSPEEYLEALVRSHDRIDVVFWDTAHSRVTKKGIGALIGLKPDRVIWISANSEWMAKDLEDLIQAGYRLEKIQPVDTEPYNAVVETVCLLKKK